MGVRNRVGIGYWHASQATLPDGIGSLESILGLLKSLKIRALGTVLRGLPKGLELINAVQKGHGWNCLAKVPRVEIISHHPYPVLHDSF
jgi:hypothetical protein